MTIAQIQSGARPSVCPPGGEPPTSGEGDFAQLMALQAPADEAPPPARADETRSAQTRQAVRAMPRTATRESPPDTPDVAKEQRDKTRPESAEDALATPALDPALVQWLAPLHKPAPPSQAAAAQGDGAALPEGNRQHHGLPESAPVPAQDTPAAAVDTRAGIGSAVLRLPEKSSREAATPAELPAGRALEEPAFSAATAARETPPAAAATGFALPVGFEPVAAAAPGASPTVAEAPVAAVPMPVPLTSPEFAAAFGLEISVLASEGVQHAELHLNPAEMGPVSVQIALDGEKARIDFGAQAAATRAVIEASLPELAAALRDAGLTLAGGGVSQHAGQRGGSPREGEAASAHPDAHGRPDALAAPAPRPAWRGRAGPGGVDLYA